MPKLKLSFAITDVCELDEFIKVWYLKLGIKYIDVLKGIWSSHIGNDCIDLHNITASALNRESKTFKQIVACIYKSIDKDILPTSREMLDARREGSNGREQLRRWLLHDFCKEPAVLRRNDVAIEHIRKAKKVIERMETTVRDNEGFPMQNQNIGRRLCKRGYKWYKMGRTGTRYYVDDCDNVENALDMVKNVVCNTYFSNSPEVNFCKWTLVRVEPEVKREAVVSDFSPELLIQWAVFMKVQGYFVCPPLSMLLVFPESLKDRHLVYLAPTNTTSIWGKVKKHYTAQAHRVTLSTYDVLVYPGYCGFGWGEQTRVTVRNVAVAYGGFGKKEKNMNEVCDVRNLQVCGGDTSTSKFFLLPVDTRLGCRCKCGLCEKPAQTCARCNKCHSGKCAELKRKKIMKKNEMSYANRPSKKKARQTHSADNNTDGMQSIKHII